MEIKIAFFDAKPYDIASFDSINKKYGFEIKYLNSRLGPDTAVMAKGFNVVCAFVNDDINGEVIENLHSMGVGLIALRCAGFNNVDMKKAFERIHIVRVPAYSPYAVAEHAAALILSLNRKTHRAYYRTRDANFNIDGLIGFDLHGKTAGVIGIGKIGKILIDILKGFSMNVIAYDHHPNQDYAKKIGFEYTDLNTVFENSDIISLHCPLTKETRHMINEKSINSMKDGVMIINTSRGLLIDSKALIEGLKKQKIGSAGLDVYEEESEYFFEDFSNSILSDDVLARILSFNNVLVTSHQAFFTEEALSNIADTTLHNIKIFSDGLKLENEICYCCEEKAKGFCPKEKTGKCF